MAVLSFSDMPKLKSIVKQFGCEIHLHDACGGQSFSIDGITDTTDSEMFTLIEDFFEKRKMSVNYFNKDKSGFIAK